MRKLMICLVVLAFAFTTSAQTSIKLNNGETFKVDLSSVSLDSIHAYVGVELTSSEFDVSLSDITLADGVVLHIFGAFIDSAFRPQLAWLDVPRDMISLFPEAFGSWGNRINISYICDSTDFYFATNFLFKSLKEKGSWEVVLREKEIIGGEVVTELQTVQMSGKFPTSEQFEELSLWR
jgi:hypothetical protein